MSSHLTNAQHQYRQTFTIFCCATLIPHSSSTITIPPTERVVLSILLTTCFPFPRILLTNLHRKLHQVLVHASLEDQHCAFVFSHSMFCLTVPLLARWFLSQEVSITLTHGSFTLTTLHHIMNLGPHVIIEPRNELTTHMCHHVSLLVSSVCSVRVAPDRDLQNHLLKERQL